MKDRRASQLGLAIIIAGMALGVVSALGLVPALRDKAALLHFPALVIAVFLIGAGLGLLRLK